MSKRKDYISWDTYFMRMAEISAQRSKDPNTQVGACVVGKENMILGIGYNGFPRGCSDDEFPWEKPDKYLYVCHAEFNALLNSNYLNLVKGSKIYVTLFPCNNCAKIIIQLGVTEVIYLNDKYKYSVENAASRKMFDAVGIKYWQYVYPENENRKVVVEIDDKGDVECVQKPSDVEFELKHKS